LANFVRHTLAWYVFGVALETFDIGSRGGGEASNGCDK
jgi:hypothetical protein